MRAKYVFVVVQELQDKFAAVVGGGENRRSSEKKEIYKVKQKLACRRHSKVFADPHEMKADCDCLDNGFAS